MAVVLLGFTRTSYKVCNNCAKFSFLHYRRAMVVCLVLYISSEKPTPAKVKTFKLFRSSMYTYNILTNTSHSLRIYWLWIIVGFTMPGNKNKKNPSVLQFAIPLDGIWLSSKLIQMEKASSIRNSNATITAKQQKLF